MIHFDELWLCASEQGFTEMKRFEGIEKKEYLKDDEYVKVLLEILAEEIIKSSDNAKAGCANSRSKG